MINLDFSPVILGIGPFQIRYYGLVYVFGFLLGLFALFNAKKKGRINLEDDDIYGIIFYSIIGVLIGARIFHIFFWNLEYYSEHLIEVFYIWQGGLSFHGGLVGSAIALYIYTRKRKIGLMQIADILIIPATFILALGRIANFINQEILGTITNAPWCVRFLRSIDPVNCRHPVQLYAAVGRFLLFFVLLKLPKNKKAGFIFWNFIFLIGVGRFIMDFLREDVRYLSLSAGQWLSIPMVIIGAYIIFKKYKEDLLSLFKFSKEKATTN